MRILGAFLLVVLASVAPAQTATTHATGVQPGVDDATQTTAAVKAQYKSDEILVKFKPAATTLVKAAKSPADGMPASVKALNAQFAAAPPGEVFPAAPAQAALLSRIQKSGAKTELEQRLLRRMQRAPQGLQAPELSGYYRLKVTVPPGTDILHIVSAYAADPNVESASLNHLATINLTPNDTRFEQQWPLNNTGQAYPYSGSYTTPPGTADCDLDAPEAWDVDTATSDVLVAVLDTGVDYNHRDLAANMWKNTAELNGLPGVDDDHNGVIDDVYGYDFQSNDSDPIDSNGHGTMCAGIIAAVMNNSTDLAGIAQNTQIMAVKGMSETGTGTTADLARGLVYAVDNGADVVSMSFSAPVSDQVLADAVVYAAAHGVMLVAAAGNDNRDALVYPARYYQVLGVGATDSNDTRASFSNYCCWVDVAAPGVDILCLRATGTSRGTVQDPYVTVASGTSMACPYAAGVAALILSRTPAFNPENIRSILKMTSDPKPQDQYIGQGRINAARALTVTTSPIEAFLNLDGYLAEQGLLRQVIDIRGTAKGGSFSKYALYYGEGANPTSWTKIHESTTPVDNGVLMTHFDPAQLWNGLFTIKLEVEDTSGSKLEELRYVRAVGFDLAYPKDNDIIKPGGVITIRAAQADSVPVTSVEYGLGREPTTWSSTGISIDTVTSDDVCARWDTSSITQNGFYTLRIRVTTAWGDREAYCRTFYFDTRLKQGWPVYMKRNGLSYVSERFVTTADLDGDGQSEIVAIEDTIEFGNQNPVLHVYNSDGTERWSRVLDYYRCDPSDWVDPYNDDATVGDIDKDGKQEIFVQIGSGLVGYQERYPLYAFRYDGTQMGGNWPVLLDSGDVQKLIADVDYDGQMELVLRTRRILFSMPDIEYPFPIYVINAQGNIEHEFGAPSSGVMIPNRIGLISAGQFDNDPELEIATPYAVRTPTGMPLVEYPAVYNLDGTLVPGWPAVSDSYMVMGIITGDVDKDGKDNVVTFQAANPTSGTGGGVYVYDEAGHVMPGWPVLTDIADYGYMHGGIALMDVEGDGLLEVVVAYNQNLYVYNYKGQLLPGWPQTQANGWLGFNAPPVIGDIDGDGHPDIVVKGGNLQPYGLKGFGWDSSGGVWAFKADGTRIDLCPEDPGQYPLYMELYYNGRVSIDDIDGNGLVDIVATSQDNTAFGDTYISKGRDSIYAWELNAPFSKATMQWPTWQGNNHRTGHYGPLPVNQSGVGDWTLY